MLTLAQAVERVRSAGFDVRMAQADARAAFADAAIAGASLRSQIGISGNVLDANEPQLGMPVARQAYAAATLSIPLSTSPNALNARSASQTARSAQTAVLATTNDAVFATVQAYRKVQLSDAVVIARQAAVTDQAAHLRVTEERIAAGKTARYTVLRDRAALASAKQAVEDATSERDQAAYDLAALLDTAADPVAVEPLVQTTLNETRDAVAARAVRQRPSVLAAEQRLAAMQTGIAAARSAYRPTAMLTAQSYNGGSSPSLGRSGGQVQLTASLPIVDGGSRSATVAKAQAQYDRAAAARDQARAEAVRDVARAWREFEAATRNLATATAVQADAAEQLRVVTLRQAAGKAIEIEILDALSVAANARETVVRSVARYDIAIAAIHHAAGDLSP
ncbi:MAG: TolC family protein [Candidatus Eremiobacteraeota bacterium]|nr:TolC family protein [Candidatus Eremiobacteraeota bacterium]